MGPIWWLLVGVGLLAVVVALGCATKLRQGECIVIENVDSVVVAGSRCDGVRIDK